jgi:hypothetical protein
MPATILKDDSPSPANEPEWDASKLYRRSPKNRRVLFLELLVWAIHNAEQVRSREEFKEFEAELREVRESVWSQRPWRGAAAGNDAYLRHVASVADVFANASVEGVSYPGRKTTPAAAAAASVTRRI